MELIPILLFWVVIFAVVGAWLGARVIGPWVGEKFVQAIYGGGDDATIRPQYSKAEARYSKGLYAESLTEFRKVFEEYPNDIFAHVRISEILIEHFQNPADAVKELQAALPDTRMGDQRAVLLNRRADISIEQLHDFQNACTVLRQIVEQMPKSKFRKLAEERLIAINVKRFGGIADSSSSADQGPVAKIKTRSNRNVY